MIELFDTNNESHRVETPTKIVERLNADAKLTLSIIENEQTKDYIKDISKMWRIRGIKDTKDKQEYVIVNTSRQANGTKQVVQITAREYQFDYLAVHNVYENISGSRTATAYFSKVFEGTPFGFVLSSTVGAEEWQNAGCGEDKLTMFQKGLERYNLEFTFDWNAKKFTLISMVNREPSYYISTKLNANNLTLEEDATAFYTYRRGYGDFSDEDGFEKAKLIREYTHPLAAIPGIGKREAEPKMDGRITVPETMDAALKETVDESLKLSIKLDFVTLLKYNPNAQPLIGDTITTIDPFLDYKAKVRIVEIETERNAKHVVTKRSVVLGEPDKIRRHQAAMNSTAKIVDDWINGRSTLPLDVLPPEIKANTALILGALSEFDLTETGLYARDPNNPNLVTAITSAGIGVSTDGGQTFESAITGRGINANLITTGTLSANLISGGMLTSRNGNTSFNLDTGDFQLNTSTIRYLQPRNAMRYTSNLWTSGIHFSQDSNGRAAAVIGTANTSPDMDSAHDTFTGIKAIPTNESVEIWGKSVNFIGNNAVVGMKIEIDDEDGDGKIGIIPYNTLPSTIGTSGRRFAEAYITTVNTSNVNATTVTAGNHKGNYFEEPGGNHGFYLSGSSWYIKYNGKYFGMDVVLRSAGFAV